MSAESEKLRQVLSKIKQDVEALKAGSAAPQLQNSSIEVSQGRGFIPIMENGVEKHRIGRQPDGTITSVSVNNTDPPAIPNDPVCTPAIGSVSVFCTGFKQQQYLDFSHINVYCDGSVVATLMKVPESTVIAPLDATPHSFQLSSVNLSGTESPLTNAVLATPNLVVSADIADGIITTLKLADAAVQEAKVAASAITNTKIGDNSIDSYKIAAYAIQAINLAASCISSDKIAANAVTADKILANTITALQMAANSITATQIQAGSVTANKLAAQIILATTAFIVGNPTADRLVLDSTGINQFDAKGNLAISIGARPTGGNFLTVIDPNDSTNALSSVAQDGSATFNGLSIFGQFGLNGIDMVKFLNSSPLGLVAYGFTNQTSSSVTNTEVGIYELAFDAYDKRSYLIKSSPCYSSGAPVTFRARITLDGSVPTTTSAIAQEITAADPAQLLLPTSVDTGGTNHIHYTYPGFGANSIDRIISFTGSGRVRILFSIMSALGTSPGQLKSTTPNMQFYVEDKGVTPLTTGGANNGSGTSSAPGKYTTTYNTTYNRVFRTDQSGYVTSPITQGNDGSRSWMAMLGFDYATIQTALQGSTINKVELFVYANYWAINTGGILCTGTHNDTTSGGPTTYSYVSRSVDEQHLNKPQGMWVDMPVSIGNNLRDGTATGLVFDSRACSTGDSVGVNYGTFRDMSYTDSTVRPQLRITYTK